jgi:hypothetical protein
MNLNWGSILESASHAQQKQTKNTAHTLPINGDTFSRLINVAGRQRMLSQRIVLNILLSSKENQETLKIARDDLELYRQSHSVLVYGNSEMPGVFFDELKEAYFGTLDGHNKNLQFINLADQALSAFEAGYRSAQGLMQELSQLAMPIVGLLNKITLVYEAESKLFAKEEARKHHALMSDIQNIAKQAKIVAVNAQIAAARAGDVGRKFSVVATELTNITEKIDSLVRAALIDASDTRS